MNLVIIGAGGHGRVVADIARQIGKYDKVMFLDDHSINSDVVGKCNDYLKYKDDNVEMYPAFGNNQGRIDWENKIIDAGIELATIIHPLAYISPCAEIAKGCVIMPCAIINTGVVINKACIVNVGAIIDHDCILEEGCHIAPGGIVKGENYLTSCTKVDSGEVIPLRSMKRNCA